VRISFHGKPTDEPEIRVGFIGCGSHAFRNIYPTFQFAPADLVATCDLDLAKAEAFAAQFGAERAYDNRREMLDREELDAVFIVVHNNVRVVSHRTPPEEPGTGYGSAPNYFTGEPAGASALWEPEFSLGQLYNKGLFLLGYYNEVNEFAGSVLEGRPPAKGTLEHAWQATGIFEAFAEGPGKTIPLPATPQERPR